MPPIHLSDEKESAFPNLRKKDYHVTTDADWSYNCIAHAADEKLVPWWPTDEETEGVYWPSGVDREETVQAFVEAYRTIGYRPSARMDVSLEAGVEKIVIYIDSEGKPCHAAKQLPSGAWTSKLGNWEDIEHTDLHCLEAGTSGVDAYGTIAKVLTRKIPKRRRAKRVSKKR